MVEGNRPLPAVGTTPEVSVIMPVYNAAGTLDVAVESVLAQSLSRLEIIVVDDGSSDDSPERARALAERDPRVRTYRYPCNRGQAAARNLALAVARGRWVALVDADDEIEPDRLRGMAAAGDAQGADFIADSLVFAGIRRFGELSRMRTCITSDGLPRMLTLEAFIESDIPLNGRCSFGYLKPLMRRSFLERWELRYDEDLRFAEDLNLYVQALLHGAHFVLDPRTQYVYNQTPISVTRNRGVLPRIADQALLNNQRMCELVGVNGRSDLDDLLSEHRRRWSMVLWFNHFKLALREGRISDALQLILECPGGPQGVIRLAQDRARIRAVGAP